MLKVINLKGRVVSGYGEGEFYVNLYAKCFKKVLGFIPYPGTLNVMLDPKSIEVRKRVLGSGYVDPIIIHPPRISGYKLMPVRCYPALLVKDLMYEEVYIVEPEASRYGLDVIELISNVNLRKALRLTDGDEVEIRLEVKEG